MVTVKIYKIERGEAQFHDPSIVQGAKWVQGRWPGTWALDFSEENDLPDMRCIGFTREPLQPHYPD